MDTAAREQKTRIYYFFLRLPEAHVVNRFDSPIFVANRLIRLSRVLFVQYGDRRESEGRVFITDEGAYPIFKPNSWPDSRSPIAIYTKLYQQNKFHVKLSEIFHLELLCDFSTEPKNFYPHKSENSRRQQIRHDLHKNFTSIQINFVFLTSKWQLLMK